MGLERLCWERVQVEANGRRGIVSSWQEINLNCPLLGINKTYKIKTSFDIFIQHFAEVLKAQPVAAGGNM